eukprot:Gb_29788 [translate_table: standard]
MYLMSQASYPWVDPVLEVYQQSLGRVKSLSPGWFDIFLFQIGLFLEKIPVWGPKIF